MKWFCLKISNYLSIKVRIMIIFTFVTVYNWTLNRIKNDAKATINWR